MAALGVSFLILMLAITIQTRVDVCPTLDLNIVLDTGMEPGELQTSVNTVRNLVKMLPLNQGGINIALYQGGDNLTMIEKLTDNKRKLSQKLSEIRPAERRSHDMGNGFAKLRKYIATNGRRDGRRVVMFFSDGLFPHPNTVQRHVVNLRRDNVTILAIIMGHAYSISQMEEIVSDPISEHLLHPDSDFYSNDVLPGELFLKLMTYVCVCPIGTRLLLERCEPIEPRCDGQLMEVVFMLDMSFSIGKEQAETYKRFLDRLTTRFRLGPSSQKIALVTLSSRDPQILANLGTVQDSAEFAAILRQINTAGGVSSTFASEALNIIKNRIFGKDGRRVLVLLSDGSFSKPQTAFKILNQLVEQGIEIHTVGFKQAASENVLKNMTKSLKRVHLFDKSTPDLAEVVDMVDQVSGQICGRKIPDEKQEPNKHSKTCTKPNVKIVCEHWTVQLSCPSGQTIKITRASYGRHNRETCPSTENFLRDIKCHSPTSASKVKEICEGKESCAVAASNSIFGDPCAGTYKYLEVKHKCCSAVTIQPQLDLPYSGELEQQEPPAVINGRCRLPREVALMIEWRELAFGKARLNDIKELATVVISALDLSVVRLNISEYGHAVWPLSGSNEVKSVDQALDLIKAWKGGNGRAGLIFRALDAARGGLPLDADTPKYVVFITGGVDSAPKLSAKAVKDAIAHNVTVIGIVLDDYLRLQKPYETALAGVKRLFNGEPPESEYPQSNANVLVYSPPQNGTERAYYIKGFKHSFLERICRVGARKKVAPLNSENIFLA